MDVTELLTTENRAFAEIVGEADHTIEVPTCPGWTIAKLAAHVGRGDRWAATIVRDRADAVVDPRSVADGTRPTDTAAERAWLEGGATALIEAVAATGADTPVWTFVGPRPAQWWLRRRLHEVAVHRADAAIALGVPFTIDPAVAADGVSEWLGLVADRPADPAPLAPGATLHLHATDDGLGEAGEWILRGTPSGVTWEHGHQKADTAVRGPAADLLLAILRRSSDGVQVLGDPQVWTTWLERTRY